MQAIAQSIEENLRALGRKPRTVEGLRTAQWVLIDYGDVVVHIFLESVRAFYDLERCGRELPGGRYPSRSRRRHAA